MRCGVIRAESDGLTNPLHREIMAAGLVGDDAEVMPRVGVVGLRGQDLPVKCLGVLETSGLVVLKGQGEGLLRGHDWEERRRSFLILILMYPTGMGRIPRL